MYFKYPPRGGQRHQILSVRSGLRRDRIWSEDIILLVAITKIWGLFCIFLNPLEKAFKILNTISASYKILISFILQETAKETFRVRRDSTGTVSKDNLIQIGVYYQSLNTRMISEEPKYQVILFETEIIIINDLFNL